MSKVRPLRLFVAAHPPPPWIEAIERLKPSSTAVRDCQHTQLHLTIHFVGNFNGRDLDDAFDALESAPGNLRPIVIRAVSLSTLPQSSSNTPPPRLLAILTTNPPELHELHRRFVRSFAFKRPSARRVDTESFVPHLTIHRYKPGDTPTPRHDPITLPDWTVTEIHLIQSTLKPTGPIHTRLATTRL